MLDDEKRDTTVVFTDSEMKVFEADACLDHSNEELSSRMGVELVNIKVLADIVREGVPFGASDEIYEDHAVYADKLNPTRLIIDAEYQKYYFTINRPKNMADLEDILQERLQEIQNDRKQHDEEYEVESQRNDVDN